MNWNPQVYAIFHQSSKSQLRWPWMCLCSNLKIPAARASAFNSVSLGWRYCTGCYCWWWDSLPSAPSASSHNSLMAVNPSWVNAGLFSWDITTKQTHHSLLCPHTPRTQWSLIQGAQRESPHPPPARAQQPLTLPHTFQKGVTTIIQKPANGNNSQEMLPDSQELDHHWTAPAGLRRIYTWNHCNGLDNSKKPTTVTAVTCCFRIIQRTES